MINGINAGMWLHMFCHTCVYSLFVKQTKNVFGKLQLNSHCYKNTEGKTKVIPYHGLEKEKRGVAETHILEGGIMNLYGNTPLVFHDNIVNKSCISICTGFH